ncbi:TetR/AcrR family transcriptional regulator [Mycobacterium sp. B14F4]|uniref:TetR/AcrR family transcriptional regulator n=1 Tax=Mycobacterium sp. B14F4 TaxID=3153565 RepID=UPI00325F1285
MLDAAQDLLLRHGTRAVTGTAIAELSGAPVGSIYHRFGSLEVLIARLWMRAVSRSQAAFLAAIDEPDTREAAVAAALSVFDFCREHPADAQLLASFGREDLIGADSTGPLADEFSQLNRPVEHAVATMAQRLYSKRTRRALDRTMLAVFDLPYGAVKRHLVHGTKLPAGLRHDVETAVRAVIDAPM